MAVSVFAPFAGRNAFTWFMNISSIGGAVSMAYTSLAAMKFSISEKRTDMIIFGSAGFILSVSFVLLLLIPMWHDYSLRWPSYVIVTIWTVLGGTFFYLRRFRIIKRFRKVRELSLHG